MRIVTAWAIRNAVVVTSPKLTGLLCEDRSYGWDQLIGYLHVFLGWMLESGLVFGDGLFIGLGIIVLGSCTGLQELSALAT